MLSICSRAIPVLPLVKSLFRPSRNSVVWLVLVCNGSLHVALEINSLITDFCKYFLLAVNFKSDAHNIQVDTDELLRFCVFVFHCIQKNRKTAKPIKEFCRYTQYYYVDFYSSALSSLGQFSFRNNSNAPVIDGAFGDGASISTVNPASRAALAVVAPKQPITTPCSF